MSSITSSHNHVVVGCILWDSKVVSANITRAQMGPGQRSWDSQCNEDKTSHDNSSSIGEVKLKIINHAPIKASIYFWYRNRF